MVDTKPSGNGMKLAIDNFSRLLIAIMVATMGFLVSEIRSIKQELTDHELAEGHPVMQERVATLIKTTEEIRGIVAANRDDLLSIKARKE